MTEANLTIKGKQVLDYKSRLPIKIKIKGNTPNEAEIKKLKQLKQDVLQDVDQPESGLGSTIDDQLGKIFSFPTTSGARMTYQAGKDIISNIGSFGFDIASFFTEDKEKKRKYKDTSKKILDFAPDIKDLPFYDYTSENLTSDNFGKKTDMTIGQSRPTQQNIEDVVSTFGQYGSPALGATKLINATNLPKYIKYPANLLGVSASEVAVTNPDKAVTIADTFGLNIPTKINENDSNLEKRLKVGAEGLGIMGAVDTIGVGVKKLLPNTIKESVSSPFSTETQKNLISKNMAEAIYKANPEKFPFDNYNKNTKLPNDVTKQLIKNIDDAVEIAESLGVKSTTGTSSKNLGLIAMERGLSTAKNTSSAMTNRKVENITNMTKSLEDSLKTDTKATSEFIDKSSAKLLDINETQIRLTNIINEAEDETANLISTFKNYGKKDPSILSSNIDQALKADLEKLVVNKNTLFNNIDPNGTVILEKGLLKQALKKTLSGEGKRTPFITSQINKVVKNILSESKTVSLLKPLIKISDPKSKRKLTYLQISKIRPILTSKINFYMKSDNANGEVIKRLSELKKVINTYTDDLINSSDPNVASRAKQSMDYYKNTFTPAWKEGVGKIFKDRISKSNPFLPSATANQFIIGKPTGGSKETINQLNNIIRRASKTEDAQASIKDDVNDYLLYQFAQKVTGKNYKTNLESVQKFIENNRQILKTPEFEKANNIILGAKRELQTQGNKILNNNSKLKELQEQVSQRQKDLGHKALNNLIDQDPDKFVQATLRLPLEKSLKIIDEAKALVKSNTLAEQGLKNAFIDYAYSRLIKGSSNSLGEDVITSTLRNFDNFVRGDFEKIYTKVLGTNGIDTIKKVHSTLKEFNNINIKAVTDSGTANLLAQALNNSRIFLASIYGIIKGGAIFRLSELVSKALGFTPKQTMEELLVMSFLDPELGKEMLKRANGQTIKPFQLKMKSYIANNLPEVQETSQQNQKKRFALAR